MSIDYTQERVIRELLIEIFPQTFEGTLTYTPIEPGSIELSYGVNVQGWTIVSDDGKGRFSLSDPEDGANILGCSTIDYESGKYFIQFNAVIQFVDISYDYSCGVA